MEAAEPVKEETAPSPVPGDPDPQVAPSVRLLLPLWFVGDPGSQVETLAKHTMEFDAGAIVEAWRQTAVRGQYTDDLLPHAASSLFSATGGRTGYYFRMPADVLDRITGKGLLIDLPEDSGQALSQQNRPLLPRIRLSSIELFLSGFGIAILSLSIELQSASTIPLSTAQAMLYWLGQRRSFRAPRLRLPHLQDDAETWQKLDEHARRRVLPPPDDSRPAGERLGRRGGTFTLSELCDLLVPPGLTLESEKEPALFHQFLHHSILRFDHTISFADLRPATRLGHVMAACAQLEELTHPGALGDELPLPSVVFNARHVAASCSMGAVHFIGDQYPLGPKGAPIGFDGQRTSTAQNKYFAPFLLALWQDQYLRRASITLSALIDEQLPQPAKKKATQSSGQQDEEPPDGESDEAEESSRSSGLLTLRTQVAEFDGACMPARTSVREAHNRYYDLVREGLRIDKGWREITRGLSELEAIARQRQEQKMNASLVRLNEEHNHDQRHIVAMQEKMEWVEIFLVGVYAVYLVHYLGENFEFPKWYVGWSIIGGTAYAWLTAAVMLRPWSHQDHASKKRIGGLGRLFLLFFLMSAPLAIYLWIGMTWVKKGETRKEPPTSETSPIEPR